MTPAATSRLHAAILEGLVARGCAPSLEELAVALDTEGSEARAALHQLEAEHGLVLHPGTEEVWVVPPFALVPTAFWVENERRGWWASCIWCALGVAALVGGKARVHTRLGGESEEVCLEVQGEAVRPDGLVAHFPIPVARAWDNVHRFCGSTLVFQDEAAVDAWCVRHGIERGDVQPLERVNALARRWYGGHLARDWVKWTVPQAAEIFASVGLGGKTWELPRVDTTF